MRVLALQRFVNMARLIRETCQHEKPSASEMTPGTPGVNRKQTRASRESYFLHAGFPALVINGENKNKAIFEEKKGNRGASADARLQGGTRENRISRIKPLPRKTRKGVHAFWGLWHLDGLLTLLKSLFFSITRARFEILF